MAFLNKFKNAFAGSVNKYSGKKDFLEAVCAACALVAAADGELEDAEITQTIKGIASNPALAGAFPSREIEQPTVLDNVTDTVKEARKGLGSMLSRASKAISGDTDR